MSSRTVGIVYHFQEVYSLSSLQGTERREVKQFHYTGWPDFGVPDHPHPVLAFIRRLKNFKRTTQGPDIIHCRYMYMYMEGGRGGREGGSEGDGGREMEGGKEGGSEGCRDIDYDCVFACLLSCSACVHVHGWREGGRERQTTCLHVYSPAVLVWGALVL